MAFVMTLSLLPAQVLAAEPGTSEEAFEQTLILPVIQEGDEAPEPQGYGAISTFALTPHVESISYAYVGDDYMSVQQAYILDPETDERVTEKPASNGFLQLLDENDNVAAASENITYYNSTYKDDTHTTQEYYVNHANLDGTGDIPAGSYTLQLVAGNITYPCEGTLLVVGGDELLINNANINDFYPGASEFEVSLSVNGFETEEELSYLSFQLMDGETVVAQSSGGFRDFNVYGTCWNLYAQMVVKDGQSITEDTDYSLRIDYTGEKTLVDGVGAATRRAYTPDVTIEDFQVVDAQTATVSVSLAYLTAGTSYRVTVGDNDTVYASQTLTAEADTAEVEFQLRKGGTVLPLTAYGHQFKVEVFEGDRTYYSDNRYYDNPYYNLHEKYVYFYPYYLKPTATKVAFRIEFHNGCSYWQGAGDVLSLRDSAGVEVGSCDSLALTQDGSSGVITGTLTVTGTLKAEKTYYLYLNGVQFDTAYVTEELRFTSNVPMMNYSANTFWTNLDVFPMSVDAINSSGSGKLVFRSGETDVLSSGTISGVANGLQDMLVYSYTFTAEDFAALTPGQTYQLVFRDGNGTEESIDSKTFTYVAEKIELDWSDYQHSYINWHSLKTGNAQINAHIYFGDNNGPKNITAEDLAASVKKLSLSNDADVFTVTHYTGEWVDSGYSYDLTLTLNNPVTAGSYTAYWNGTELETNINISQAASAESPSIWDSDAVNGYVYGQNLPTSSTYTGKIYSGYTCLTENSFSMRLQGESDGDTQYLYFDKSVIADLEPGTYELRVYMDGKVLDSVDLIIVADTRPIITLNDDDDDNWKDEGDPVMQVPKVWIEGSNMGAYGYLRWAETEEALADANFEAYFTNRYYGHTFEGEDGPRTLYVELSKTGQSGDAENLIYTFDLWLWTSGDYEVQVPEAIQGVQNPANKQYTITATAALPATELWVSFFDADGEHASQQMEYVGPTEDGRYEFTLSFGVGNYDSFSDYRSYTSNNGHFYYKDTQSIQVFATDLSDIYNEDENWDGNMMGQPVERVLAFGDPANVILPQFTKGPVLTNQTAYTIYGYAAPGNTDNTVTVSEGDIVLGTATANDYGYFSVKLTDLAEGVHTLTVADDDTDVGDSTAYLKVDTTAPVIGTVTFTFLDNNAAALRWECSDTDVDYFQIYKNNVPLGKAAGNTYSYNVTASANDGNMFTVDAVDLAGNKASKTVSTADQKPPTAPTNLALVERTTTTASLSWTAGTDNMGVAGYNVYQAGTKIAELTGTDTTYTVTGLEQGGTYSFTVKTRDKAGILSEDSTPLSVTTVTLSIALDKMASTYVADECANKRIPVAASVTANDESYSVQLDSARLEYRASGQTEWNSNYLSVSGAAVSGTWGISGSDGGYLPMGRYELRVIAVDSHDAVVTSGTVSVTLKRDDEAPTVPGVPTADSHSTTSITFHWTESTDNVAVDHYEIWRGSEKIGESKVASYTDTGLTLASAYSYTVKAVDARGNTSAASQAASLSTAKLEFDSVITFESSYTMESQTGKNIAVWAKFKPEAGYAPDVTMMMEYKMADSQDWTTIVLSADTSDANLFNGVWNLSVYETGYLPAGTYQVRFAVSDGSATAYSSEQAVVLERDKVAPVVETLTPANTTVGGKSIQLYASATDNVGVVRIEFSYAAEGVDTFTSIGQVEAGAGNLNWDASALASGSYTIKAAAYDLRGNTGDKTAVITIDNTPPAVPGSFTVTGTSRYIHVMWDTEYQKEADFSHFCVYRSESADSGFEKVATIMTIGYFDSGETADAGKTYYYYVTAADTFGNESGYATIASATLVADNESPVIGDMLPREDAVLQKSAMVKVTALDNYRLAKAVFSYRPVGTEDWTVMGEKTADTVTNNCVFAYSWAIPAGLSGSYQLRVQVYDDSINNVEEGSGFTANDPAEQIVTVTIKPYSAPVAPVATAVAGYKTAALNWTYGGDLEALRNFNVYQTDAGGANAKYVTTVKAGATGSCTVAIPSTGTQYFVVEAVDKYWEAATCAPVSVTSLAGENEPPVAVILPETLTAAVGHPFSFSGVNSTDNDEIVSYAWDFGDESTGAGARCEHTYTAAGTYTVKLTVTDASGNTDTAIATMNVYEVSGENATHALMTVKVVNAYQEGTPAVAGADIRVTTDNSFAGSALTGADGTATFAVPLGNCTVSVTADGYLSTSRPITVEPEADGTFTCTIGITPMNVSLVDGSLTAEEMTYDEILAAGIDVINPDNNHVWKFAAELEFVAAPAFPFELGTLPLTGYYNSVGDFVGNGTGWGWNYIGGGGGGTGWGMNVGVFPISEHFVLVIYGEAHWLKEMYNVELLVINNSYTDDITDCVATLDLPEGLSLAAMTGSAQNLTIDLGTIPHKTSENVNANTDKANWYVRGDAEGEYNLTATVTGRNPEPFVKTFTTDKPVKVYAGSALKLHITAGDIAYRGEEYHVRFQLENVSDKDLYNLSFGLTGAEQFKVIQIGDQTGEIRLTHEDFGKGMTKSIDVLKPGGSITIDFYTTTWFNSALELADLGPFDVGYYLTNVFVTTLEGSSTEIPYDVQIEHTSHGTFFEWAPEELAEKGLDILDKDFFGEVPILSTGLKVYKFISEDNSDAASRAVITIDGGYFTASNNFLRSRSLSAGAVSVYTDAPEGSYTISPDGKTMTITGDATIYVQGEDAGEATMTVTTYTEDGDSFQPNVYTMKYTVSGEAGTAEDVILQAPQQSETAVPLDGETSQVTFPHALKDADGNLLADAANAEWTLTGEDTTGLNLDKGVLTIASTAKAGTYTVRLAIVGTDKYAEQTITLTREASVPTTMKIFRDGATLLKSDTLVLPVTDESKTYTYTAKLLDQYGVEMDTTIVWDTTSNTSDAQPADGVIILTRNTTVGSLTLTASANGKSASVSVIITNLAVGWSDVEDVINGTQYVYGDPNGKADLPESGTASALKPVSGTFSYADGETIQDAGERTVTVVFTVDADDDTYAGASISRVFPITISKKPLADNMISITGSYTYTGSAITPAYTVTDGSLLKTSDYQAALTDNVNAGTATVTVTAAENGNYIGTATGTFTIAAKAIAEADFTTLGTEAKTYTGSMLTQTIATGLTNADYEVVYANNINVGTATYTITGKGNYTGSFQKQFTIDPATVTVTPDSGLSKTYGADDPTLTYTMSPASLAEGSTVSGKLSRAAGENVGTYTITLGTLSAGSNYNVVLSSTPVNFSITAAAYDLTKLPTTLYISKTYTAATIAGAVNNSGVADIAAVEVQKADGTVVTGDEANAIATFDPDTDTVKAVGVGKVVITYSIAAKDMNGDEVAEYSAVSDKTVTVTIKSAPSGGGGGGSIEPTKPISSEKSENGSVAVDTGNASEGDTVTITVKPDEGYELSEIIVTDKNGNRIPVTLKDGEYTFTMPDSEVTIQSIFKPVEQTPFTDVAVGAYYRDAVLWAVKNGITSGTSETTFGPNDNCTRAQIVTFLWRAAGSPEPESLSNFADVSTDSYYAKAVAWAVEQGITKGTSDTTFSPNATCTRAQAMTFIYRSEQAQGGGMQGAWMFLNPFSDVDLENYYGEAVMWAVANGVTNGTSDTTFSPNNDCTRAQIVTFLFRCLGGK